MSVWVWQRQVGLWKFDPVSSKTTTNWTTTSPPQIPQFLRQHLFLAAFCIAYHSVCCMDLFKERGLLQQPCSAGPFLWRPQWLCLCWMSSGNPADCLWASVNEGEKQLVFFFLLKRKELLEHRMAWKTFSFKIENFLFFQNHPDPLLWLKELTAGGFLWTSHQFGD